jgi:hypothetical protein
MGTFAATVYWLFGACVVAGFAVIGFSWERMRRQVNRVSAPGEKILWPPMPQTFGSLFWKTNDIGYFLGVLDRYLEVYPSSPLPRNVALGVVVWILCLLGLLASGVGR